jgi:transcriptional regulator with XRE-family HTH domain
MMMLDNSSTMRHNGAETQGGDTMKIKPDKTLFSIRGEKFNEQGIQILEHIKEQAKKAREETELSQRELSNKVNRSKSFISKMEKGDVVPSVTDLLAMSIILEKPLKYFIPDFAYYKDAGEEVNGEEWELLKAFRRIHGKEVKRIAIRTIGELGQIK